MRRPPLGPRLSRSSRSLLATPRSALSPTVRPNRLPVATVPVCLRTCYARPRLHSLSGAAVTYWPLASCPLSPC
eukprot:5143806-Pyramimonas_sp.AAC.1